MAACRRRDRLRGRQGATLTCRWGRRNAGGRADIEEGFLATSSSDLGGCCAPALALPTDTTINSGLPGGTTIFWSLTVL